MTDRNTTEATLPLVSFPAWDAMGNSLGDCVSAKAAADALDAKEKRIDDCYDAIAEQQGEIERLTAEKAFLSDIILTAAKGDNA